MNAGPVARLTIAVRVAVVLAVLFSVRKTWAQVEDGFEGPDTVWQLAETDCQLRVEVHRSDFQAPRSGYGCELIQFSARRGTYAYAAYGLPQARIIEELNVNLWIKADRPGIQLMAHVVFPRTIQDSTGQPVSTFVRGASYSRVGSWQQLVLEQIPRLVERQVRILRSEIGFHVDPREAYIDYLCINLYGGPGLTNVRIDDLAVNGLVSRPTHSPSAESPITLTSGANWSHEKTAPEAVDDRVRLDGSVLMVDGSPFFARVIDHQGESFDRLRRLGFNTIQLRESATRQQMEDAQRLGLWIIAPAEAGSGRIGASSSNVLAWDLGRLSTLEQFESSAELAGRMRQSESNLSRPLICRPQNQLSRASRFSDILVTENFPIGSSFPLSGFGSWMQRRQQLARAGTPYWAAIQTEPAYELVRQISSLAPGGASDLAIESEQIRLLTYMSLAAGARGLHFTSGRSLGDSFEHGDERAATLELINLELSLIEPWVAAGQYVATVPTSDPAVRVAILSADRARLLLLYRCTDGSQYSVDPPTSNTITFVIPGVPNSSEVYRVTASRLQPLRNKRVTGGTRMTVEDFHVTAIIVMTQDPLVVRHISERLKETSNRWSALRQQQAALSLARVQQVHEQLVGQRRGLPQADDWLQQADTELRQCIRLLEAGDDRGARQMAGRSLDATGRIRRAYWQQAAGPFQSPVSSPCLVAFATLPIHWDLRHRLASASQGPNRLAGGNFEDLQHLMDTGWRHHRSGDSQIQTDVDLTPQLPYSGRYALRLRAWSENEESVPEVIESPPVWITSAPVRTEPGQLFRIHGWVNVPTALAGTGDGLKLFDSLGGPPLALRIGPTRGWQQFVLYRSADQPGSLHLTFVLSGLGEAKIDAVTVARMNFPRPSG